MNNGDLLLVGLLVVLGLWTIYSVVKLTIVRHDMERFAGELRNDREEEKAKRWVYRNGEKCPACETGKIVVRPYNAGEGWTVTCNKCGELFDED